jgi:hypothetical protein
MERLARRVRQSHMMARLSGVRLLEAGLLLAALAGCGSAPSSAGAAAGAAATAAPHLLADLQAIVGAPKPGVMQPQGAVNPGGPDSPA